jgi:hypothetical protein
MACVCGRSRRQFIENEIHFYSAFSPARSFAGAADGDVESYRGLQWMRLPLRNPSTGMLQPFPFHWMRAMPEGLKRIRLQTF